MKYQNAAVTTPEQLAAVNKIKTSAGYFDDDKIMTLDETIDMWCRISRVRPLKESEQHALRAANIKKCTNAHLLGEFTGTGKHYHSNSGQRLTLLKELGEDLTATTLSKDDFDILSAQRAHVVGKNKSVTWTMPEIASIYIACTCTIIEKIKEADLVIYLDKSARPVEWFVKEFWPEDGTSPPKHMFINIDRVKMLRLMCQDASSRRALFGKVNEDTGRVDYWHGEEDVQPLMSDDEIIKHLIDPNPELVTRIRAIFVKGAIPRENWQNEVGQMSTGLNGKRIVIIDEVKSSGLTIKIAEVLISQALSNENPEILIAYYWDSRHETIGTNPDGTAISNMTSIPVWYDNAGHHTVNQGVRGGVQAATDDENSNAYDKMRGRLVGDPSEEYYDAIDTYNPTPKTFAQKLGAVVLSAPHFKETELQAGAKPSEKRLYIGDIDALKLKRDIELMAFAYKNNVKVI